MKRWTTCCQSNHLVTQLGQKAQTQVGQHLLKQISLGSVNASNVGWIWVHSSSTTLNLFGRTVCQLTEMTPRPDDLIWTSVRKCIKHLLTSEEHRLVQEVKAQKEAFGLHTETLGDPARAAGSITVWKADSHWVVGSWGEVWKRAHYRDCILAGVLRGGQNKDALMKYRR